MSKAAKRKSFRGFELTVSHLSSPVTLIQAAIDPKHGDVVVNGYGAKKKQIKALRDWLTQALRYAK